MKDIYFTKEYGEVTSGIEGGENIQLKFSDDNGEVIHQFIKRPIFIDGKKTEYFDLITPYGYGGPMIDRLNGNKADLINNFNEFMTLFCNENNIVSEFVRFHPLFDNALDFESIYNSTHIRNTVATKIVDFPDDCLSFLSKKNRYMIRKCIDMGMSYECITKNIDLSQFKKIYYDTMNRNNAESFYYFDDGYFNNILEKLSNNIMLINIVYNNNIIASALHFTFKKNIHLHLAGTDSDHLSYSPARLLSYAMLEWGKKNKYEIIHHGGGVSNAIDDPLYKFKKQFSNCNDYKFFIGKKIWNLNKYEELCEIYTNNAGRFPLYR